MALSTAGQIGGDVQLQASAGCSGIATASAGCSGSRARLGDAIAARPHILAGVVTWVQGHRPHLRTVGAGCSGVATVGAGCSGGSAYSRTVTRSVNVQTGSFAVPGDVVQRMPAETTVGAFGDRIEKAAVHRQLKKALRQGNVTPEQRAGIEKVLADPDAYNAAVSQAHKILTRQQMTAGGPVGKIGDGTILQLLLANLPAIIDAVMKILAAFGL